MANIEIGDIVRIKDWDKMLNQYGLARSNVINVPHRFTSEMETFCGKRYKVVGHNTSFSGRRSYTLAELENLDGERLAKEVLEYTFSEEMFEEDIWSKQDQKLADKIKPSEKFQEDIL